MLRKILIGLLIIGGIGGFIAYDKYKSILGSNVPDDLENNIVVIPSNSSFQEVVKILHDNKQVIDTSSFREVAEMMNYKKSIMPAGRYKIDPSWSNRTLIGHLRSGKQEPVNLVLNHGWVVEDVAAKAAQFIEADSADLADLFFDENYIKDFGYDNETLMSLFIPNTYEFFWNKNEKDFFKRMVKEHNRFWQSNNRLAKAEKLGMNAKEVYTLASIVERETAKNEEKKRVAGLYLNRIRKGMKLEADPTAKFATRGFKANRVLYKHTRFDSPYNTYLYEGLPPGPISMASITSIDAVLNSENHDYIFMCARPDLSGYHAFSKTLAGHNKNAKKYHRWLDSLKR